MKKRVILISGLAAVLSLCGCSTIAPQDPLKDITLSSSSSEETSKEESSSEEASESTESAEETKESQSSEPATDTEATDSTSETDESGNIVIDIDDNTKPTSQSGRMEDEKTTYTKNNISINYPVLLGMTDDAVAQWANDELYKDACSIIDLYEVDLDKDTLTVDYEVSVIYRSEFSLVYTGTLVRGGGNGEAIKIRLSDDLDLSEKKHVRLSDRLSAAKLSKAVLETGEYTILSKNFDEATLKEYLTKQPESFYTDLLSSADFGGSEAPSGFSYNSMGNVAIIIPVPHMFGDYAEISIKQQTK